MRTELQNLVLRAPLDKDLTAVIRKLNGVAELSCWIIAKSLIETE